MNGRYFCRKKGEEVFKAKCFAVCLMKKCPYLVIKLNKKRRK